MNKSSMQTNTFINFQINIIFNNSKKFRIGYGYYARLRIEWSGFEPWPRSLCYVLRQDTLLSQCFSSPRSTNGYQQKCAGGNPAMD